MADSRVSTFQKTLTTSDKELIRGSTGWDIDTDPSGATAPEGARRFALRLMLDRYSLTTYGGADGFTGQVDQSYIQHVIQEQLGGQEMVPLSVLYKVQSYLSSQTTIKTP